MFRFQLFILILLTISLIGCSNDSPVTPEPQTIIVEVPCPEIPNPAAAEHGNVIGPTEAFTTEAPAQR